MAGLAYHKIITKGLHGGPACEGLITAHFSLYCTVKPIPIPPSGGGGPYPGPAWNKVDNITKFYDPIEQQYYEPSGKVAVSITVAFKDKSIEKIYIVTPKQKDVIVKIMKILNITFSKMAVQISNMKTKVAKVINKILNIRNNNLK